MIWNTRNFPGTNLNDINLDWLIRKMKDLDEAFREWPHSPRIENGEWYVYDEETGEYVSTGVSATGEQGPVGPRGPQGERGPQGVPGEVTQAEFDELSGEVDDLKSAVDAVSLFEEYMPEKFEDTRYNRKVTICKNNITIEKTGADSATYCHYSLFGHKFLGTGSSVPTSQLTDDDFITFTPYVDAFILQRFTTVVSTTTSIYSVITKNPETEEIKSVQGLNSKFGTARTANMFDLLPDILSNGNFGLVFTSMSNQHDAEKFWIKTTMRPVLAVITNNILATYNANKAYAVGDVLFVAGTLYRVSAAIANGAQLIPNTNIVKTTVADLIKLSNS